MAKRRASGEGNLRKRSDGRWEGRYTAGYDPDTGKAGKIIEEANDAISTIHQANENGVTNAGETYSEQDCKKDLAVAYVQTSVKFAKLYAPAVLLGAASVTSILASHNIMKKRKVVREEFLTDPKNGDFDTVAYLYVITPEGKKVELNGYFKDGENGMVRIGKAEYDERKARRVDKK